MAKISAPSMIVWTTLMLALVSCGDDAGPTEPDVDSASVVLNGIEVSTWMYQIQFLDERPPIDELDATDYDMLVVEPGFNFVEDIHEVDYLVSALKRKSNGDERVLVAGTATIPSPIGTQHGRAFGWDRTGSSSR